VAVISAARRLSATEKSSGGDAPQAIIDWCTAPVKAGAAVEGKRKLKRYGWCIWRLICWSEWVANAVCADKISAVFTIKLYQKIEIRADTNNNSWQNTFHRPCNLNPSAQHQDLEVLKFKIGFVYGRDGW
jgi:hypothetical protein